jgi:CheY-like chemotaxis protein
VAEIGKATQRASELTTSLLAFSRKLESRLRPVDLGRLIRETQGLLERSIPKMIRIDFHLEKGLTAIQADPAQVEQVLINLVVNARDAMPDGGHLTIETDMAPEGEALPPVSGDAASGPFVRLRVTDTGQGMDQRTLDHIYEPFFTTKATGQGTGLGLSIVYGIMKSHGGLIHCASQPQRGTRFTLLFPSTDQPVEDTAAPVDHAVPGGRETILLVDDEPALRELGQELLQDHGYRVFLAPSGELALQMVEANPYRYDLVLLDVIMPGMGGERCLEELLKRVPELKVILVSGFSASGSAREFMERGAKGFVFKPYRLAQLLRAIRAALDGEGEGGGPAA